MANIETLLADSRYFAEASAPSTPAAGSAALYVKTDGKIYLKNDAGTEYDLTSTGSGVAYVNHRLLAVNDNVTVSANVNSATYISLRMSEFYHDWDFFAATHFLITGFLQANEAAQTITLQLATQAAPTNPVSAAGDDLVVTNTQGVFSSGWIAVSDAMSGLTLMTIAYKGSNTSVDFSSRWLDIAFKIV